MIFCFRELINIISQQVIIISQITLHFLNMLCMPDVMYSMHQHIRGTTGGHETHSGGTQDEQAEVQQRPYTKLRIHITTSFFSDSDKAVVLVYTYLNSGLM